MAAPELVFVRHYIIGDDVIGGGYGGGVVLVPVHIWKPSKISLANAYLYLHAYVAFVSTDDKHASWLFLFDTVVKCLCLSINAKSLHSFITYNWHFIVLN